MVTIRQIVRQENLCGTEMCDFNAVNGLNWAAFLCTFCNKKDLFFGLEEEENLSDLHGLQFEMYKLMECFVEFSKQIQFPDLKKLQNHSNKNIPTRLYCSTFILRPSILTAGLSINSNNYF